MVEINGRTTGFGYDRLTVVKVMDGNDFIGRILVVPGVFPEIAAAKPEFLRQGV